MKMIAQFAGNVRLKTEAKGWCSFPVLRYFTTSILFATIAIAAMTAAGCGKSPDIPIIASGPEYKDVLAKAEKLSTGPIEKFEAGEALNSEDKNSLREAQKQFDGLIAFAPNNFGAYFGASRISAALGNKETAFAHMRKFIELAPQNPIPEIKRLLAEAHYYVGKSFEDQSEFELAKRNAERSVGYFRNNPNYLALLASCRLRENRGEEAHKLVDDALKLDPNHARSKQLHAMMKPHLPG